MKKLLSTALVAIALTMAAPGSSAANVSQDDPAAIFIHSRIGAEVDGAWLYSTDYPSRQRSETPFHDRLGRGTLLSIRYSGRSGAPNLVWDLKRFNDRNYATILVHVENATQRNIHVTRIRLFEGEGKAIAALGGDPAKTRVLSDSYSEDTPVVRIHDFNDVPRGVHVAVGSQLLYNRETARALFAGALTSARWLTVFHLRPETFTIDDEGTTELTATKSLSPSRPNDYVTLQVACAPGEHVDSEELLVSAGRDYLQDLRDYGAAVRVVDDARVSAPAPWGWWSFTAFYFGLSEGLASTNADWLAAHLATYGFNYLHLDEGYDYTRGDYTKADPVRFPSGMIHFARAVTRRGLTLGVWTAPFEVSERSWVYRHHKDWLVTNPQGEPIWLGKQKGIENIYALDPTNPGAQEYLKQTYQTLAQQWGVGYIKMDFIEMSDVEGIHYRPNTSAIEAERIGLRVIRDAVGDGVILDKDGSPMLAPVGLVDAGRLSNDTEHSFQGTFDAATGIAARFYMNRNFYIADPDDFCVSNERSPDPQWDELKPVTFEEAKAAITLSAMAGGMFEIGDDLPSLAREPERLALVTNPELLKLLRLNRSATPLDLMTYARGDLQPGLFWIRESDRQGLLAIFNWTHSNRKHEISFAQLGLGGAHWRVDEVFGGQGIKLAGEAVQVDQPAHSVRLIRLVDESVPAIPPQVTMESRSQAQIGQAVEFKASVHTQSNPILGYSWNFGDGTSADGATVTHTFTHDGPFNVTVHAQSLDGPVSTAAQRIEIQGTLKTGFSASDLP